MKASVLLAITVVGVLAAAPSGQQAPVTSVPAVDLSRYVGTWFEVARYPNRFQRTCVSDVRAMYTIRADGRLTVTNQCRKADGSVTDAVGEARIEDTRTFARLKVRFAPRFLAFLPVVWGDYWVIGLADDYGWAVVGTPDRKYLWVLSRTAVPSESAWAAALEVVRAKGFDETRLVRTRHTAP